MQRALFLSSFLFALSLAAPAQVPGPPRPPEHRVDLVVYGGTSAGVMAAVEAHRLGLSAVLIEPGKHVGGLSSGGLGATDIGNKAAIGGIAREFYQRLKRHYAQDASWTWQARADFRGRGHQPGDDAAWTFEPHVAEALFKEFLSEQNVPLFPGERLDLKAGVTVVEHRIQRITMESGRVFLGRHFIDATYEGDLLAKAGVSYTVGREARSFYGESCNGVSHDLAKHHQFVKLVDPWVTAGDPTSGLLPGISAEPAGMTGDGDHRVQAYCLRLCATNVAKNRVPWPKPKGYDPARYELLLRNFEAGDHRIPWHPVAMPNGKTDSNNNYAVSTDHLGANYAWPDGDYATRERIYQDHLEYTQGLLWTLAHHPRVPEKVRDHFNEYGLSKDEFVDNGHWPHQLYVREARRMISDYVMTQSDCQGRRRAEDSIGLAAYTMDSHHVQRSVDPKTGAARNEGDVQVGGFPPYPIAYRALLPKRTEIQNLAVPVCLSASHIAFGSIRMEPVFMVLAQSAVVACALAKEGALQDVPYPSLRAALLDRGQVLDPIAPTTTTIAGIDPSTLPGIILDDATAERIGAWVESRSVAGFVGQAYLHDGANEKGSKALRWRTTVASGVYRVGLAYTPHQNRATATELVLRNAALKGGVHVFTVDQSRRDGDTAPFSVLGKLSLEGEVTVEIKNAGAGGYAIGDAVQLLPLPK